jgi:hypothetical protein
MWVGHSPPETKLKFLSNFIFLTQGDGFVMNKKITQIVIECFHSLFWGQDYSGHISHFLDPKKIKSFGRDS